MGKVAPQRQRIRRVLLTLAAIVLASAVLAVAYAAIVGVNRVDVGSVDAVATTDEERDLVVRYVGGNPECGGGPGTAHVVEDDETVTITSHVVVPNGTRWWGGCTDEGYQLFTTVRLASPLGDREVIDGAYDRPVEVSDSLAELLDLP